MKVRLIASRHEGKVLGHTARLFLDDKDVSESVRGIDIHCHVDSVVMADLTIYADRLSEFDGVAEIGAINVIALPGWVVVEKYRSDGTRWWYAEKRGVEGGNDSIDGR